MKNMLVNKLVQTVSALKEMRWQRAIVTILASSLLILSTACTSASINDTSSNPYDNQVGQSKDLYDPVQRRVDGINQYNDDVRYDADRGRKVDRLIEQAEQNKERVQGPRDYVENLQDNAQLERRAEEFSEDVRTDVKRLKTDVSNTVEEGIDTIKRNVQQAGRNVQQAVEETQQNIQEATRDAAKTVERATEDLGNQTQDKARDVSKSVRRASEDNLSIGRDRG
jgi:vacuolar-type H+-ATPase subunit H